MGGDFFRRFELTISVWVPRDAPMPETFADWVERAFGVDQATLPASATLLERVVECRHPPADDLVARRVQAREGKTKGVY